MKTLMKDLITQDTIQINCPWPKRYLETETETKVNGMLANRIQVFL